MRRLAILLTVVVFTFFLTSCSNEPSEAEKTHVAQLETTIKSLQTEVAQLKETADYNYKRGVELQAAGNLTEAKAAFETVISKFPTSNLVAGAKQQIAKINATTERQERERQAEERLSGEYIGYTDFYAKALSSGLPVGKRYHFRARALGAGKGGRLCFCETGSENLGKNELCVKPEFDNPSEYENLLRGASSYPDQTVVASMSSDGDVYVHRSH